jgi:NurA-like 5'-3' nuclease
MYETLAKRRATLKAEIEHLLEIRDIEKYKSLWRRREFQGKKAVIGGEDGSFNFKKYKNFVLYAVNAVAYIYDSHIEEVEGSDLGILYPYKSIEERLKLYQAILELKVSLEAVDKTDLFLLDGSLLSKLSAPKTLVLSEEEREEVLKLLPKLEKDRELGIASKKYANQLKKYEKIAYLEYLEFLTTAGRLLERGLNKIVGVSKTSTWSEFHEGVSDMAVFEELSKESGFSRPVYKPLGSFHGRFPVYRELFESIVFTTFYARLEDRKSAFMFEVPREIDEVEVERILNAVKTISVEGYPYLLKKAHRRAVITNRDMERIFLSLGVQAKTGREVL